jgi:hypothetical protein
MEVNKMKQILPIALLLIIIFLSPLGLFATKWSPLLSKIRTWFQLILGVFLLLGGFFGVIFPNPGAKDKVEGSYYVRTTPGSMTFLSTPENRSSSIALLGGICGVYLIVKARREIT